MGQRSDQRTQDVEVDDLGDFDDIGDLGDLDDPGHAEATAESERGGRLPSLGVSGLFSVRTFLVALALSGASMLAGNAVIPFLGGLAGLLGVFVVGFAFGLFGEKRTYVEVGLAGAMASGVAVVLGNLVLSALGIGLPLAALGAGSGLLVAVVGHYFGRDLRDGITRSV